MPDKEDLSFEELWDASDEYVSVSNEEIEAATIAAFKKKPNCIYLERKDFSNLMSIENKSYLDYVGDYDSLEDEMVDTVKGEYLIFEPAYDYKGIRIYEVGDDTNLFLLVNSKGTMYVFEVNECSGLKGKHEQIFFTGWDYTIVYYIDKDIFEEI